MPPKTTKFTKRLTRLRKKAGLSQSEAAKAWGLSASTLRAWEQGQRQPTGLYLEKIEGILAAIEQAPK